MLRDLSQRNEPQHNVHALSRGIVLGCLFPEEIDRFPNGRVAKFDVRNNNAVQFVSHLCGATQFSPSPLVISGGAHSTVFSDGLLPGLFHFPKLTGARLVVGFFAILILGALLNDLNLGRREVE